MTTLTTALGLLPMALGVGEGSELRTPMAITVISGLLCSTLLTLIVLPVLYQLFDHKKFTSLSSEYVEGADVEGSDTKGNNVNKDNVNKNSGISSLPEPKNV
jgi:HAE1 family hydrophobic/amphiphilic exporter-1